MVIYKINASFSYCGYNYKNDVPELCTLLVCLAGREGGRGRHHFKPLASFPRELDGFVVQCSVRGLKVASLILGHGSFLVRERGGIMLSH